MTFKEIIDRLKEKEITVEDFAYNFESSYDLNSSPAALIAQKNREEFRQKYLMDVKALDYNQRFTEYTNMPNEYTITHNELTESLGFGKMVEVDSYGGEGQGDTWYSVKHFVDHDVYIRVNGYYTSYEGTSFDGGWACCSEVKPVEKTITVYNNI